jgi:2-succinyl-6-hydroxy-2,4-cyclohexadiene-1-carboxylate synthase
LIHYNFITSGNTDKPALVFLHGFLGCARDWSAIISQLSADYYCLAIDLPGHGKSVITQNDTRLHLQDTAIHLNSEIRKRNLIKPVLIGYSMGGRMALHMLTDSDIYWQAAILESTSPGIEDPIDKKERLKNDFQIADRLEKEDLNEFLQYWYSQPLFSDFRNMKGFEKILERRLSNDPVQMARALRAFSAGLQESFWNRLKIFNIPVLMISGANDKKYSAIINRIAADSSTIRSKMIPDCGHVVHAEQPQIFCATVLEFLRVVM